MKNIKSDERIPINDNFKVEAGPGAGKTRFLVNHIIDVISNSDSLSSVRKIACITYTNTAVDIIRDRLGLEYQHYVEVCTIHNFLYMNVIKPYFYMISDEYGFDFSRLNGHDTHDFLPSHLSAYAYSNSTCTAEKARKKLKQKLSITSEYYQWALCRWLGGFRCIVDEKGKPDFEPSLADNDILKDTSAFESQYVALRHDLFWRHGMMSHEDVLFFAAALIHKYPFIVEVLKAGFPYIFIDEYQDTHPMQAYILEVLRTAGVCCGVIGDKAQAIYGFMGADVSLFENFKIVDDCRYEILDNFRSSSNIVNFLNSLRSDLSQRKKGPVMSDFPIYLVTGDYLEAYEKVKNFCDDVVTLSRENNTIAEIYQIRSANKDYGKIFKDFINVEGKERTDTVVKMLKVVEYAQESNFKEAFNLYDKVCKHFGISTQNAMKSLHSLVSQYDDFKNKSMLDFYNLFKSLLGFNLQKVTSGKIKAVYENTIYSDVALGCRTGDSFDPGFMTIHKAKGAEFDNVFITDDFSRGHDILEFIVNPDLKDEETRVFYVGCSRAKKRLFLNIRKDSVERLLHIHKTGFNFSVM